MHIQYTFYSFNQDTVKVVIYAADYVRVFFYSQTIHRCIIYHKKVLIFYHTHGDNLCNFKLKGFFGFWRSRVSQILGICTLILPHWWPSSEASEQSGWPLQTRSSRIQCPESHSNHPSPQSEKYSQHLYVYNYEGVLIV